jgi:hypothetical protein
LKTQSAADAIGPSETVFTPEPPPRHTDFPRSLRLAKPLERVIAILLRGINDGDVVERRGHFALNLQGPLEGGKRTIRIFGLLMGDSDISPRAPGSRSVTALIDAATRIAGLQQCHPLSKSCVGL